jgi:hypothetical protein
MRARPVWTLDQGDELSPALDPRRRPRPCRHRRAGASLRPPRDRPHAPAKLAATSSLGRIASGRISLIITDLLTQVSIGGLYYMGVTTYYAYLIWRTGRSHDRQRVIF